MDALSVDATAIARELGASITLDRDVSLDSVSSGDTVFVPVGPVHLDATLSNTGTGIVLYGTASAKVMTACSRCLRDFSFDLTAELEGLWIDPVNADELPEDQEWEPIGDGVLDIMPAVLAAILVELPFAPLHTEDCAGICPSCGCDLNEVSCTCHAEDSEPGPFDALKDLFPDDSE